MAFGTCTYRVSKVVLVFVSKDPNHDAGIRNQGIMEPIGRLWYNVLESLQQPDKIL